MAEIVGNASVLDMLEQCLTLARERQFNHLAISMVGYPNQAVFAATGDVALEVNQRESLQKMLGRIERSIDNWTPPPTDDGLGFDYACYNAANGSLGFDFFSWLVDAEMRRRRARAPAPLKVGFWCGKEPDQNHEKRQHWLDHVFRPALRLIGAVEDERAICGYRSGVYVKRPIVEAAKRGEAVPMLSAGAGSGPGRSHPDAPVTITLREAPYWPHRNSDLPTWHRFALDLKRDGHRVVFIRDTAKAHEPIAGFETLPLASVDLIERTAAYEAAKANLFVANGPVELAVFGRRPWLQFVAVEDDDSGYRPNTPKFWADEQGVPVGEQYPWSNPAQRIVWEAPSYAAIHAAWDGIRDAI